MNCKILGGYHSVNKSSYIIDPRSYISIVNTDPAVCLSSSLCTGIVSWPKKRLMIGRLFANLSLTSISKTSIIRATKVYFCRPEEKKCSIKIKVYSYVFVQGNKIINLTVYSILYKITKFYSYLHLVEMYHGRVLKSTL